MRPLPPLTCASCPHSLVLLPLRAPSSTHRALSILAPLSYIGFLVGSLWLFSKIYRRRQANKPPAEPWFPPHKSRDIYVSLLSLDPPPPRPILVAALLRRAMDDVKLIWQIRDAKTSLTTLLGKGQIGDDLWERFLAAEKELDPEIVEVVGEANTFEPGYGNKIFNAASDMVSHERWKDVYRDISKRRAEESVSLPLLLGASFFSSRSSDPCSSRPQTTSSRRATRPHPSSPRPRTSPPRRSPSRRPTRSPSRARPRRRRPRARCAPSSRSAERAPAT